MKKYGFVQKILHTIESCYLCMKYPFLYPRNRWNGKHYNNWKLHEYIYGSVSTKLDRESGKWVKVQIDGLKQKAYEHVFLELDFPDPDGSHFRTYDIKRNNWYAICYHVLDFYYEYILPIFHCIPTYNEWDSMPEGWNKAFGKQYLNELKSQLKKDNMLYSWRITDLKEKYGSLNLYCNFGSKELYEIIDKYEKRSYKICIVCGKSATKLTGEYILPYCDECFPQDRIPYAELKNGEWKYNEEEW